LEQDSLAEDPDAMPSLQLAWEMIELARHIYKTREEVSELVYNRFLKVTMIKLNNLQTQNSVTFLLMKLIL
jgi:hypothetical protein